MTDEELIERSKIAWNKTNNDFFVLEYHKLISSISDKLKTPN